MAPTADNSVYDQVLKNMQTAAESNLKMQQEMLRHWSSLWPKYVQPESDFLEKAKEFQKQWHQTITELAEKHRNVFNSQYQTALTSLEEALQVGESTNAEEFRERAEQLCRKSLDCLKEISETQMSEFQDVLTKWSELMTQATSTK
ncbi:MAG: hypothetical protein KDA84_27400 [Planctomycetaceae bacterium]|nr:hypothetical protein [Planctomycetaceae bacterium]